MVSVASPTGSSVLAAAPTHTPPNPAVEQALMQIATILAVVFASATVLVVLWLVADDLLTRRAARRHDFTPKSPMAPSA